MQEIVERHQKGQTIVQLQKYFHKSRRQISKILTQYGLTASTEGVIRSANTRRNKPIACLIADKKINNNITKTEWAYIAGFFDAEGCIEGANRNKKSNQYNGHRISISQNETEILEWIQKKIGNGIVKQISTRKQCHMYRLTAQKLTWQFLVKVCPYLIVKKIKALNALVLYKNRYGWKRKMVKKISNKEKWAYIAGMLDGDGCVTQSNNRWRIAISQKGATLHKWLNAFLAYGRIKLRNQPKGLQHLEPVNNYVIDALLEQQDFAINVLPFIHRTKPKILSLLKFIDGKIQQGLHGGVKKLLKNT